MFFIAVACYVISTAFILQQVHCQDPCYTNRELNDLEKRFNVYEADTTQEALLCDRHTIAGTGEWFIVPADQPIVTNATRLFKCGTHYPIWMNGTIPSKPSDGIVNREVCVPDINICSEVLNIKVKHCGRRGIAYWLQPTNVCPQAYCFGYGEEGLPPSESIPQPTVEHLFYNNTGDFESRQELAFKCAFDVQNMALFYQVYWFIDGKNTYTTSPHKMTHEEKTYLKEGPKMIQSLGIKIQCSVRARLKRNSQPGNASPKSKELFAGINVLTPNVNLVFGHEAEICIQPTIPFGCSFNPDGNLNNCYIDIELTIPNSDTCTGHVSQLSTSLKNCGVRITRDNWNKVSTLTVTWKNNNNDYIEGGVHHVGLIVNKNGIWNFTLPSVKVVLHKSIYMYETSQCFAYNDPHMRTFDGHEYESHGDGRYILFRHKDHSQEVQIQVTPCNGGKVRCTCALAVRAGQDVFVINRCSLKEKDSYGYTSCHDGILEVISKTEYNYQIYLPSGTMVDAIIRKSLYTRKKVLNVVVYPSVGDYNRTEGLCGNFNNDTLDDFTKRDGSTMQLDSYKNRPTHYKFPSEWKCNKDEDLFTMTEEDIKSSFKEWPRQIKYCDCKNTKRATNFTCSPVETVKCLRKKDKIISKEQCMAKLRKKRSAKPKFSYIPDNFVPLQTYHRSKRSVHVNMTSDEARQHCEKFLNESATIRACSKIPNVDVVSAIELCALDIELTGTLDWAESTRDSVRSSCMKEITANKTLQKKAENGIGLSVMETIERIACPNECSGQGQCLDGNCVCDAGYGSSDCSLDLNVPPEVNGVNIDEGGICDVDHCNKAYVTGDDFIDSRDLKCRIQKISIDPLGNKTEEETTYVQGHHDSLFEVHCPLSSGRSRRRKRSISADKTFVVEFRISVSNTGKIYSPAHSLFVLDAECQDVANVSGETRFVLRDGYCFINGKCIGNGMFAINDNCNICDVSKSRFEYSYLASAKDCKPVPKESNLWLIGAVLGPIGVISLVVVMSLICKKKLNKKQRIGDSTSNLSTQLGKPPAYH